MRAPVGALRERVTLQSATVSVDAGGDPALAWSDVATVWGRVRPAAGGVEVFADRRTAHAIYEVTIRWRPAVTLRNRLLWRGRTLQIDVCSADERRVFLTLECRDTGTP